MLWHSESKSLRYFPGIEPAVFCREVCSDFENLFAPGQEWLVVSHVLYLLKGKVCALIPFELDEIDKGRALQYNIYTSVAGMEFRSYLLTHKSEQGHEGVLEGSFKIALDLVNSIGSGNEGNHFPLPCLDSSGNISRSAHRSP